MEYQQKVTNWLNRSQAGRELARVQHLSAFNVQNAIRKEKVNQHLTRYFFPDASRLDIHPTKQKGIVFAKPEHKQWAEVQSRLQGDCFYRVSTIQLKINK